MGAAEAGKCEICSGPTTNRAEFVVVVVSTSKRVTATTTSTSTDYAPQGAACACVCDECGRKRQAERHTSTVRGLRWCLPLAAAFGVTGLWIRPPEPWNWVALAGTVLMGSLALLGVGVLLDQRGRSSAAFAEELAKECVVKRLKERADAVQYARGEHERSLVVYSQQEWSNVLHAAKLRQAGL